MVSVMVSFCAVLFPAGVLDEILNLIGSFSEGFPSYSCTSVCTCYFFKFGIKKTDLDFKNNSHSSAHEEQDKE